MVMKTIRVNVRFTTNGLPKRKANYWSTGFIDVTADPARGIDSRSGTHPFNSLAEIPAALEKLLIKSGIKVHPSKKLKKYIAA